jgi:hypothetical protein
MIPDFFKKILQEGLNVYFKLLCIKIEFSGLNIPGKNLWQQVSKRKETKPPNKQQFIISPKQYPAVLKREKTP